MSTDWQHIANNARELRRELHTHPELGWQEQRTAGRVRETLTALDIPWRALADTGTVATLGAEKTGTRHIALRGDMDALPIVEQTGKPWSSVNNGCMHACGHDGHTATLLATAHWLKQHEHHLPGPVSLLFQPAEEGGHGARKMIEDGALKGVDEIFGWHNWPALPFGVMVCPDDVVMCGNGTFDIAITGKGGHASQPELCRDPLLAGSAMVVSLQQVISRRLAPQQAAVLSVTSFEAPSGATIIPQTAQLGGSIRVPDEVSRETINSLITEICIHTAASYGVEVEVTHTRRYSPTCNHPAQALKVRKLWREQWGGEALVANIAVPIMASEDFSYYLNEIPGAFALIGADDGPEHQSPCHSPHYDFNDRLIPMVTALFAALAGAPTPAITP
ncbi:MAG TPA: N(2)-acetyl-L-2,4-diaminobutanoate deacetylase DoeB2 [Cellvibrionaceae bacterium]